MSRPSITLVCGLRGSGKSTWAKAHLGESGLCYDMDAIASAFRLRMPHEEYCPAARRMANDFLMGFMANAGDYTDEVIVIRTAPRPDELDALQPDRVVMRCRQYVKRPMDDVSTTLRRLEEVEGWCQRTGTPCERVF